MRPPTRYRPTLSGDSLSAARPIDLIPPMITSHVSTAIDDADDDLRNAERRVFDDERDRVRLRERRRRQRRDGGDERKHPREARRPQSIAQVVHRPRQHVDRRVASRNVMPSTASANLIAIATKP